MERFRRVAGRRVECARALQLRGSATDLTTNANDRRRFNGGILSTPTTRPAAASDWEIHSHQDKELVKGLGLTSATMLVMGSMIGSGIFIVSAEIAREVDSPALLIGAWAVAGFMTIVAALSYGELAAMMPRAGGQYVYLREALGPLVGISLRLDVISGDSDRNDRRRGRGFRQVPGSFLSCGFFFHTGFCISGKSHRFVWGRWFWATWMWESIRRIWSRFCWWSSSRW